MDSKSKGKRVMRKEPRPWQIVKPKKGKQRKNHKVEATSKDKQRKKEKNQEEESDEDDMADSDEEEETPMEGDYVCFFESKESDMRRHSATLFVKGFDCSVPTDEIRSSLIKHFTSSGGLSGISVPYECQTGSPLGFAFINTSVNPKEALALNGSYLGERVLEVALASERLGYNRFNGCVRCRNASVKRMMQNYYESFRTQIIIRPRPDTEGVVSENEEANGQ